MRVLLAVVAMTAPAFAGEPAAVEPPVPPPAPIPASQPGALPQTAPEPQPEPLPAPPPPVDPAYGERPDDVIHGGGVIIDDRRRREIVVRYHPDRSRDNITMLAITGGAGLLVGALGLYFHFDARSATDDVASDRFTGETWSGAHQEQFERAERSSLIAGISYGVGGALLIATAIMYIATEPELETRVIRPHAVQPPVAVVPVRGGAVVGSGWSF